MLGLLPFELADEDLRHAGFCVGLVLVFHRLAAEGADEVYKEREGGEESLDEFGGVFLEDCEEDSESDPAANREPQDVPEEEVFEGGNLREVLRKPENDGLFPFFVMVELPVQPREVPESAAPTSSRRSWSPRSRSPRTGRRRASRSRPRRSSR